MEIYFGTFHEGVAEYCLDDHQVFFRFERVAGETVAQGMGDDTGDIEGAGLCDDILEIIFGGAQRQPVAFFREEQCRRCGAVEQCAAMFDPLSEHMDDRFCQGQGAFFAAFAVDMQQFFFQSLYRQC